MTLLTTTEAARRCGVSGRTLLRWLTRGELPGVQTPGGHWRVEESALAAFLSAGGRQGPKEGRVLIVEDDPHEAEALARIIGLLAPGVLVERAHDGLAAGLLLGVSAPDVAFVDIEMPGLDGIEVVRRARQISALAHTRFVVVSGRLTSARVAALEELGVQDILRKPVDPDAVRRILREAVQARPPSRVS